MGTKNNPGSYDCYANADPDEPMFILLGRDRHAPALVRIWALLRQVSGEDPVKVAEAFTCSTLMSEWRKEQGRPPLDGFEKRLLAYLENEAARVCDGRRAQAVS